MYKYVRLILIAILLCMGTSSYAKPPIFVDSPEDAFALSEDINIDVLLVFTASWCPSCVVMKNDIDSNLDVVENTIVCYVDHDKRSDMVKEYKVKILPTYFLYRKKLERKRESGYKNISKFKEWIKSDK